jgi:putative transposase
VSSICHKFHKSRAAYYKLDIAKEKKSLNERILHELTIEKRKEMPRLGGKKTYHELKPDLDQNGIKMGRDKYFEWLRAENMLIRPKRRYAKTTNSFHRYRMYDNKIKDLTVTRPDQVWVSDITYLRLQKGFCYLALITDVFSRKIVGYDVSSTLEVKGALQALEQACHWKANRKTIHHSDRGFQYCSKQYTSMLKMNSIEISMGEVGNCYENALAERVNGILKSEFNLDTTFMNINHALKAVKQSIKTYNELRPHMAIGLQKPNDLYAA